ncbi:MAG TPA: hypothetical protein VIJ94_18710 [Caulobacteraceae bacterium]
MTLPAVGHGNAVARAVGFLRGAQLGNGEFETLLGSDKFMSNAVFDSSPFVTSFVVFALTRLPSAIDARDVLDRACGFLQAEMEPGGVWRYWTSRQAKHLLIPPDLDDTACISFALKAAGRRPPDNLWGFRLARDDRGRFLTWVPPSRRELPLRHWPAQTAAFVRRRVLGSKPRLERPEDRRFEGIRVRADDIDPVVNANALLYLGESAETAAALAYVQSFIADGPQAGFSIYYQDPLFLFHAVARACQCSAPSLAGLKDRVVKGVLARADSDGRYDNPICAAAAACALGAYDPGSAGFAPAIDQLLETQRGDGGWDAHPFYAGREGRNFWGSEALTTALSLEALILAEEAAG